MGSFFSRCKEDDFHLMGMENKMPLDDVVQETDAKLRDAFDFFKNEKGTISGESCKLILDALDITLDKDIKSNELNFSDFNDLIQSIDKMMNIEGELIDCLKFLHKSYTPSNRSTEDDKKNQTTSVSAEDDDDSEFPMTRDFIMAVLTSKGEWELTKEELDCFKRWAQIQDASSGNKDLPSCMNTPKKFIEKFMSADMQKDLVED